jgi:RNA 2',3'-cyclic 3'-phosphodiesterase
MNAAMIGIPLPNDIKSSLSRLCYGIPEANWTDEENFYLNLRSLETIDGTLLLDLKDALNQIFDASFSLSLNGIGLFSQKNSSKSTLWAGVERSDELQTLKRHIESILSGFKIPRETHTSQFQVVLAKLNNRKSQHVYDFLANNGQFHTRTFSVDKFSLLTIHHTLKRTIYTLEAQYFLSKIN